MMTEEEIKTKIEDIRLKYLEYLQRLQELKKKQVKTLVARQEIQDKLKVKEIKNSLNN